MIVARTHARTRFARIILTALIAFGALHSGVLAAPLDTKDAASILLAEGARRLGLPPDQVEMFGPTPEVLPNGTGRYVLATVAALGADAIVDLWLDLDSATILSRDDWNALIGPMAKALGPITPELALILDEAPADERLTVAIGVYGGSSADVLAPVADAFAGDLNGGGPSDTAVEVGSALEIDDPGVYEELADAIVAAWSASALQATAPVALEAARLGMSVEYSGRLAPVIWVTGTPEQVRALAQTDGILDVYPSYETSLTMSIAGPTDQADYSYANGHRGAGSRVAVVEYANVDWSNGHLSGSCHSSDSTTGVIVTHNHPAWVSGAIVGQLASQRGVAPSACLISIGTGGEQGGGTDDWRILAAIDLAVLEHDAQVINLSIVQNTGVGQSALRDYIDHVVRTYGVHVAASGGNPEQCGEAPGPVLSPGTAWNVVTVGTLDDRRTTTWADDLVNTKCSVDPPGGPFKPEVSAPGTDLTSAGINSGFGPWASIAVPQVAGTFAQLIGINPGELAASPIRTKAIILAASHVHMVNAGGEPYRLDSAEGIGSLTSKWSDIVAKRQVYEGYPLGDFGRVQFDATYQGPCYEYNGGWKTFTISTKPGRYVRVVVDWFSHAFYNKGTNGYDPADIHSDQLRTDLDLVVTGNGETYTSRWHNGYNVAWVQFVATTDTYTGIIEVYGGWSCTVASEPAGWAYVSWNWS